MNSRIERLYNDLDYKLFLDKMIKNDDDLYDPNNDENIEESYSFSNSRNTSNNEIEEN